MKDAVFFFLVAALSAAATSEWLYVKYLKDKVAELEGWKKKFADIRGSEKIFHLQKYFSKEEARALDVDEVMRELAMEVLPKKMEDFIVVETVFTDRAGGIGVSAKITLLDERK